MYRNVDFPIFVFINTCLVNYEVLVNDEYRKRLFTFLFFIKVHAFHELSKLKILVTCLTPTEIPSTQTMTASYHHCVPHLMLD